MYALNPPSGFDPFGGAGKSWQPSADGAIFWSQCGRGPRGFGVYVFRAASPQARAEYVWYREGNVMEGRGDLNLTPLGLFIDGSNSDKDEVGRTYPVPGYVPFVGGAQVAPDVYNGMIAALAESAAALNSLRSAVSDAQREAQEANKRAADLAAALAAHVAQAAEAPAGITASEVVQISANALYEELSKPSSASGIVGRIEAIFAARLSAAIARWVTYQDKWFFNALWDRGVRLLIYREANPSKAAKELPVNSQEVRDA